MLLEFGEYNVLKPRSIAVLAVSFSFEKGKRGKTFCRTRTPRQQANDTDTVQLVVLSN